MVDNEIAALRQMGRGTRGLEDSVSYSVGHRIRIEIRAALHEGPATASQLAKLVGEPLSTVEHHIREMLMDGTIEIAKTVKVGNLDRHYYSVVKLPYFSDEALAVMSEADRQTLCAITVQAAMTEVLASLWAGTLVNDPRVMLAWNRINLDKQGRDELADEELRSWCRKHEIEAKSANRRAKTGEPGVTYVITSFGYERSRKSAPRPLPAGQVPAQEEADERVVALRRLGKGRSVEKSVSYSLGHRIRIEIQAALHEGPATAAQLAKMVGEPLSAVKHHIKEMLKDGTIEIAKTVKVGNLDRHYYSVVKLSYFSDGDAAAMSEAERQTLCAITVQAAMAEVLASLWAGKLANDPRVMLAWNRINLDRQGRDELADEELRSWCRKHEIEAKSANRRAKTGEPGVTYVITSFSYERSRTSAPESLSRDLPTGRETPIER